MTRILEFQPTDEQTVVARVLVELHQAIDINFPGANPSARQFTKTVLTNHAGESTRIDNVVSSGSSPDANDAANNQAANLSGSDTPRSSNLSLTPKTNHGLRKPEAPLATEELRQLLGQTTVGRRIRRILVGTLVAGIIMFLWIYFAGAESLTGPSQ